MAEVSQDSGAHKKGGGKKRSKKLSTRIDFTPMVDLGFLLITFFMLATSFIKPQTMEIALPSNKAEDLNKGQDTKASRAITIVCAKDNRLFYYYGQPELVTDQTFTETNYSDKGLRMVLLEKNIDVVTQVEDLKKEKLKTHMSDTTFQRRLSQLKANKNAPVVRIMVTDDASYKNMVAVLDEMNICSIAYYALVNISPIESSLLKNKNL
jgi:biopolymer transport protein ExbD